MAEHAPTLNVRPLTIADLKPHPQNYNTHPEAQLAELVRSIRRHGPYRNAVVSADGYILAGHGILAAARMDGWTQWPCEVREYNHDHPDALNLLLTDNEVGNPANPLGPDPDQALLAALARQVNEATGLEGTGLDEARLAELLAATETALPEVEDPGPGEPPKEPVTKPGDVWVMRSAQGMEHRVVCGDCRDDSALSRLFGNERARMVWTDPPYGVDYVTRSNEIREALGQKASHHEHIANDALSENEVEALVRDALTLAAAFSLPGATCYVACPPGTLLPRFIAAFDSSGFAFRWQLCWAKNMFVLGHGDYHFKHENVLYGWKPDAGHLWNGDHSQTSVFEVDKPHRSEEHPTMKPVELVAPMVTNSSRSGEIVLDPFLGSGTTLIACEQTGRRCFGVEIEPRYVDVSVRRWCLATKQPVILESTGAEFPMEAADA